MNISGEAPAAGLQLEEKPATHFFEVNQFSIVSVYTQTLFFRTNVQNDWCASIVVAININPPALQNVKRLLS